MQTGAEVPKKGKTSQEMYEPLAGSSKQSTKLANR